MDSNHPILSLISELGFPIVTTLAVAGGMWVVVKWLMTTLERDISAVQEKLGRTQEEQYTILVKLIDRVRALEDGITRVEMITRTAYGLNQEWGRVGRANKDEE